MTPRFILAAAVCALITGCTVAADYNPPMPPLDLTPRPTPAAAKPTPAAPAGMKCNGSVCYL